MKNNNIFVLTNFDFNNSQPIDNNYFIKYYKDSYLINKKMVANSDEINIDILTGYLYSEDGYYNTKINNINRLKDSNTIIHYDGKFSYVNISYGKITFFTDAFGLEKLYMFFDGSNFLLSNKLEAISKILHQKNLLSFDRDSTLDFLVYGYSIDHKLPIKNLKYVQPGEYYNFEKNKTTSKTIFNLEDFYLSSKRKKFKDKFGEYRKVYNDAINNYIGDRNIRIGCYVSAGLDSRTNAYILSLQSRTFLGITYDCADEADILASLQYGALTKNPILNCFMPKEKEKIVKYMNMASELHGFTQPAESLQFFPDANLLNDNIDVIVDGASGDIFMGSLFNTYAMQNDTQKFSRRGILSGLKYNNEFVNSYFNNSKLNNYEKNLLFNLQHRQRYWIIPALDSLYTFAEPFAPTYNKKIVEFLFSLDENDLKDRTFHKNFLNEKTNFNNIKSDYGKQGLNPPIFPLVDKLIRRLKYKFNLRKLFFKEFDIYGLDTDKYYQYNFIKEETYDFLSNITGIDIAEFKNLRNTDKTSLLVFQNYLKNIMEDNN